MPLADFLDRRPRALAAIIMPIINSSAFASRRGPQGEMSRSHVRIRQVQCFWQRHRTRRMPVHAWSHALLRQSVHAARRSAATLDGDVRSASDTRRRPPRRQTCVLVTRCTADVREDERPPSAGATASGGRRRRRRYHRRGDAGHGAPVAGPAEQYAQETTFLDLRVST